MPRARCRRRRARRASWYAWTATRRSNCRAARRAPRAHLPRRRRIVVHRRDRVGERAGDRRARRPGRSRPRAQSPPASQLGSVAAMYGRPAARMPYTLLGTMKPSMPALQRDDEHVGGRERIVQQRLGLVREEADVGRGRAPRAIASSAGASAPSPTIANRQPLLRPQPVGRVDQHVEVLRQADIARVHHARTDRRGRARARRRCPSGPGTIASQSAQLWMTCTRAGIGALFLDQPAPHAVAERDDRVGVRAADTG